MKETIDISSSEKFDIDWNHVKETVMMLNVAVAQIQRSMIDGDASFNALAESFTSLVREAQIIYAVADNLQDSSEKDEIISNCLDITSRMQDAIVAFQFYDKLMQRMSHIRQSLSSMGNLISEPSRLYNSDEWHGLQAMIKSKYTLESDRKMFDAILKGATIDEALNVSEDHDAQGAGKEGIELF